MDPGSTDQGNRERLNPELLSDAMSSVIAVVVAGRFNSGNEAASSESTSVKRTDRCRTMGWLKETPNDRSP